ncbi:hypothetical protein [Cellulomonas iranensis]|uniref:Tfp pilus assembly protein PilO n=1 Tax=Cellulomonas iranensis TaxID=76862 RepID=A0ABU0GNX0_9CELL|nr:hypothetical protein [Cellulomonas iranensis]MDQ0427064.1 Tfp pilus assembly protein PilO [Cellulomonas iranensis]
MRSSKATPWIAGAGVVVVLLLVGAWFLAISPVLTAAGETSTTADQVEADNALLTDRIGVLREQFEQIDTFRAELATLRTSVPSDDDLAGYLRQLDGLAATHAVTLLTVSPSTPVAFVPEVAAAPSDAATSDSTGEDAAVDAAAAPASAAPAGLVSVPLGMTVVGGYENVRAFLDALQVGTERLYVVESVVGASQSDAEAGGGRPATAVGDLEINVSGYLFVLPDTTTASPAPEATEEPALPTRPEGRNPMVPLG